MALIQGSGGNLYGTTIQGGDGSISGGWGTAFKVTPAGVETILHSFSAGSDGAYPGKLFRGSDGIFYGTTGEVEMPAQSSNLLRQVLLLGCTLFRPSRVPANLRAVWSKEAMATSTVQPMRAETE
jgi:uncharacterized repeat protein (TIGR03803 family)